MIKAVIFDMDGTLVDNFFYHLEAFQVFFKKHTIDVTEDSLRQHAFGKTNEEIMPYYLGREMSKSEIAIFADEKEATYRNLYKGKVTLVEGLEKFLIELYNSGIKIAVGTSAPRENAEFILAETNIQKYFSLIVDGSMVENGKPYPDIYLLSAEKLNCTPAECIVFEDSFAGIESAQNAKMKVVGLSTTHTKEKLSHCNKVINNFTEISALDIQQL